MKYECHPLKCTCLCCRIPIRVVLAIMLHLSLQVSYNLRVVLNVAIVEMVEPPAKRNDTVNACPNFGNLPDHQRGGKYAWTRDKESMILYIFYGGYILSQPPGGWLADNFGGRYVLGICILVSTVANALLPFFTEFCDFPCTATLRFILGVAQGPVLPCISSMVSRWIPPQERTLLGGIAYGGSNLGTILGSLITGHIIAAFTWHTPFYFWSAVALGYLILHLFFLFSFPQTHPFISEEELAYLNENIVVTRKKNTPWKAIFMNVPFWANVAGQFGHNYIFFTLVTYLPTFMKEILQFDIAQNGFFSALPFLTLWITSLILSCSGNYIVNNMKFMTVHHFGFFFGTFSNYGAAALALAAVYIKCNRAGTIGLYMTAMVVKAFYYMTLPVNINALSRNYGGFMFGVCNGINSISGIVGNALIGAITKDRKLSQWQLAFWITFGITIVSSIIYAIWSNSERQDFDYEEDERPQK